MDYAVGATFRGEKHHFRRFERTKFRARVEEVFCHSLRLTKATQGDMASPRAVIGSNAHGFECGIDARDERSGVHFTLGEPCPDHVRFSRAGEATQPPHRERKPRVRGAHRFDCLRDRARVTNLSQEPKCQMEVLIRDRDQVGEHLRGRNKAAAQMVRDRNGEESSHVTDGCPTYGCAVKCRNSS